jgi:spermidine synthase
MVYLFTLGFISILGQVVLLRELNVAFFGVELIYTLALGVWLLSTAFGALLQRHIHNARLPVRINLLLLLFAIGLPLDVALVRSVRHLFTDIPGAYLSLQAQIAAICLCLLPIGLILGLLFRWMAETYLTRGKSLAAAYGVESIGGLAGGLCATLFLKFGFQNFTIALICGLIAAGSTFLSFHERRSGFLRYASIAIAVALIFCVWSAPNLDRRMTSWTHPNLVASWDSPYSRITATYLDGQVSVFENDALLFDTEETRAEEFAQLAALQHPNPARVLILGGGIEGTVREILLHAPKIVDYVELNPVLLHDVPQHLPTSIQKSLQDAAVKIIQDDPRQYLEKCPSYDLILVGMAEPSSGQANRFYTQEFFRQCCRKLRKDGIIAFSLQSSENLWTPQLSRRMSSIYRAAGSVFPEVLFIPGTRNVVLGSASPLIRDPAVLASRLDSRGIKTRLISRDYLRYLYTNDRFAQVTQDLESVTAPINTDVRPICYQYTLMIWLSKFLPGLKPWDISLGGLRSGRSLAWLLALIFAFVLLSRTRWPVRRALLTGVAGFAGMVLETIILLHFQTKSGILYQDIGILLTGFMAGLSFGAFGIEKIYGRLFRSLGFALIGGFAVLSAITGLWISSGSGFGLSVSLGMLFLTGALVAGVFSYAGLHESRDQTGAIAPLYSADLIGGCLGSILASLVLAPVTGLAVTSYLMIPILALSVLLI